MQGSVFQMVSPFLSEHHGLREVVDRVSYCPAGEGEGEAGDRVIEREYANAQVSHARERLGDPSQSREDHREKRRGDDHVEEAQGHGTEGGQIDHDGGKDQIDQVNGEVEHVIEVERGAST